jgi:hypothetical protein
MGVAGMQLAGSMDASVLKHVSHCPVPAAKGTHAKEHILSWNINKLF